MDYEKRLKMLKLKYPDPESMAVVTEWEKKLKLANLTANLKNHDGMKIIMSDMDFEVARINKMLTDEDFFKNEESIQLGRLLQERKKWIKGFLAVFDRAERQIKATNELIDNKLTHEDETY